MKFTFGGILLCAFCLSAGAQSISGFTTLAINPTSLVGTATCGTELNDGADDGTLASRVTCTVADQNGTQITSGVKSDDGDRQGSATVILTFQASAGTTYFANGNHSASTTTPFDAPSPGHQTSSWYDEYNFSSYDDGSSPEYPEFFDWPGFGPQQQTKSQHILMGNTIAEQTAGGSNPDQTPLIFGIDPSVWTPGKTTTVTITGQYFGASPNLQLIPSANITWNWVSLSDSELVINVNVAAGTPDEAVQLVILSNGQQGSGFQAGNTGNSPSTSAYAQVKGLDNSPAITVVGWIDPSAADLTPQGISNLAAKANSSLVQALQNSCPSTIFAWSRLGTPVYVSTQADRDYANTWLVAASPNRDPGQQLPTLEMLKKQGNYRLLNTFGGPARGFVDVGKTPNPCHGSVAGWVGSAIFGRGEDGPAQGRSGTSAGGYKYQVAQVRVGNEGRKAYQTITGRTMPWVWDVIEISGAGVPLADSAGANIPDHSMFPTYSVYQNGTFVRKIPQSSFAGFVNSNTDTNSSAWMPVP